MFNTYIRKLMLKFGSVVIHLFAQTQMSDTFGEDRVSYYSAARL